jgi:serine/threonine protein phosphatase PrpC
MGYRCWGASHRGHVRAVNEDAFAISACPEVRDRWQGIIAQADGWAMVADGMGGHAAGQVASRLALACLETLAGKLVDEQTIGAALASVQAALFSSMRNDVALFGMGTTIAGVMLRREDALCFNVGDSRIYHMGARLSLISEDHVVDGNMLTRCIGGTQEHVLPEPSVMRILWKAGQRLLVCSDGLTDMMSDEAIAAILANSPASPADALVAAALDAGGRDNVTAVVIERLD